MTATVGSRHACSIPAATASRPAARAIPSWRSGRTAWSSLATPSHWLKNLPARSACCARPMAARPLQRRSPCITTARSSPIVSSRLLSTPKAGCIRSGSTSATWNWPKRLPQNQAAASRAYRGGAIYRNVSTDGGATFGPDTKVADYSCECCRIALTTTADGQVAALWRHVFAPNIRDHAFAVLGAAGDTVPANTPVRATFDNWAIDACPHHGPGLTPAAGGGYHAVWFGDRAGVAQVRYGRLEQDGKPAGAVLALPDERAEHADILSAGKRLAIVWRSFDGSGMNLKAWVSDDDGRHFTLRQLARTAARQRLPAPAAQRRATLRNLEHHRKTPCRSTINTLAACLASAAAGACGAARRRPRRRKSKRSMRNPGSACRAHCRARRRWCFPPPTAAIARQPSPPWQSS